MRRNTEKFNEQVDCYLNKAVRYIRGADQEHQFIRSRMRTSVEDYVIENDISDIQSVYAHFGSPEEYALSFFPEDSSVEMRKSVRFWQRLPIIIFSVVLALTVLVAFLQAQGYRIRTDYCDGFYVDIVKIPSTADTENTKSAEKEESSIEREAKTRPNMN